MMHPTRAGVTLVATLVLLAAARIATPAAAQSASDQSGSVPRTPDGRPDLQGNWTNATITPVQRPPGQARVLTPEQIAALEGGRQELIDELSAPSDPDRDAPPAGGDYVGEPLFDAATGGTGGYNYFYIDAGDRVAIYDGEPRSSLVTQPANGRIPPLTEDAQRRLAERAASAARFGAYDNPENRPLGERCIVSFGSNAGPPMLPNYFYNNNYTIVQTPDHVLIMTEMVHDVRVIPIGEPPSVADHIRPWFGVSWGRWEGDTLVIETTNLPEHQVGEATYVHPGGSEQMKVIERLTRVDANTVNYEFTVIDPGMYTEPWGGQVPFRRLDDLVYEYACHEGNYALSNVLSGARAEERRQGR